MDRRLQTRNTWIRTFLGTRCANALSTTLLLAWLLPSIAFAQESKKEWRITSPGGNATVYNTQQEAVEGIKVFQYGWLFADKIKGKQVAADGTIAITYWIGKDQPNDPDWQYVSPVADPEIKYPSEEEAFAATVANLNAVNPACPAGSSLAAQGDWVSMLEGQWEERTYTYTLNIGDNTPTSPCQPFSDHSTYFSRQRRLECPNPWTTWMDEYQACASDTYTATISSKTDECDKNGGSSCPDDSTAEENLGECDGNVGNPCNVKTGEKYEIEQDFDLGWIALTRYYHSGVSTASGGFGHGWTHSLDTRLVLSGSDSAGLIEGTGYQRPFKKIGSVFEATDGSGDRLVEDGDWTLYTADAITTFDANGRTVACLFADGTWLSYAYNDRDRLDAITHSSGRVLGFTYLSDDYEALIGSVVLNGTALATYTYNSNDQVETVTYPGNGARTYHYEDSRFPHHLTGITAEGGRRYSTFEYDALGRVVSSQHAGGADGVTLVYSGGGGAVVTDALGLQTTYGLTAGGATVPSRKVSDLTDARGTVSRTYYDVSTDFRRRLDTLTDRDGTQTKHTYAEVTDAVTGQPASVHTTKEAVGLPEERITEERRDLASNRLLAITTGDREVRYAYNSRLQPSSITVKDLGSGETRVTTFTYCEAPDVSAPDSTCPIEGAPKTVDGPRSDVADITTYTYYPSDDPACATAPATCRHRKGDLWKTTNALGQAIEILTYDGAGRPLSVKDANGATTDFEYHARGWLTAKKVRGTNNASETDDQITRIEYWPTGLVKQVTQPDGSFTAYAYDDAHRLTDIFDGDGNRIHYALDDAGNRTAEETTDEQGVLLRKLSRVYNQLGQLETQKDAFERPTGFTYDDDGNLDSATDALSRVTDHDFDPLNRLKRTLQDVDGIQAETKSEYDALDNLTKVTDPKGLDSDYTYNAFGDLLTLSSPDTGTTTYTYDSVGNRKTQTDARNKTSTYSYDALNRLTGITYPTAALNTTYTYDTTQTGCTGSATFSKGRLTRMQDSTGTTNYCYDRFGNLTGKLQVINGQKLDIHYAYTLAGQLQRITYPGGAVVDYVRNSQGQVTEVGVKPSGGTRQVLLHGATYYPFGPVAEWAYGNGRLMRRSLNQNYQPGFVEDPFPGGISLGYEFNEVGNLAKLRTADQTDPPLRLFGYDDLNRLTEVKDGATQALLQGYDYDATGNRESATLGGTFIDYTYPTGSHRLSAVGSTGRGYDNAGNTTQIGGTARQFLYNDAGRLRQVKTGNFVTMNYAYNGRGEQVAKYLGSAYTYIVYDEAGRWLGDYDSKGAAKQQAIWLDDLPVGLLVGSGAVQKLHYVEPDALGTPRVVIDPERDVAVWKWELTGEAFGNSAPNQDPDGDGMQFVFDMRFPGQRYDAASGLNYNYFRNYDPGTGRYVESDPIGLRGGISTYAYVSGSPVGFVDPFGLCTCGLPNASEFVGNYPDYDSYTGSGVWSLIGGSLDANYGAASPGGLQNSCAARVSYGLNYSGSPIPTGTAGASRNWNGDDNRYIISARQLNTYLRGSYGAPTQTLTNSSQLTALQQGLGDGGAAIVSSSGHAAVVTSTYSDPYVSAYLGDVWVLPGGNCTCP